MKLEKQQLVPLLHGAVDWEISDTGLIPYRFPVTFLNTMTAEDFGWYARASAGIRVCLETEADAVELRLRTTQVCDFSVPSICEVFLNGDRVCCRDLEQRLEAQTAIHISLNGQSRVEFWLPINQTVELESLDFIGADTFRPISVPERTCLWIGDSITQGFACGYPSKTWTAQVGNHRDWHLINQGIGGFCFRRSLVQPMRIRPHRIIVSLGTNSNPLDPLEKQDVFGFFDALFTAWPDKQTVVITPIPRLVGDLTPIRETVQKIELATEERPNIYLIDGCDLLPSDANLFADGLHPNAVGMESLSIALLSRLDALHF